MTADSLWVSLKYIPVNLKKNLKTFSRAFNCDKQGDSKHTDLRITKHELNRCVTSLHGTERKCPFQRRVKMNLLFANDTRVHLTSELRWTLNLSLANYDGLEKTKNK